MTDDTDDTKVYCEFGHEVFIVGMSGPYDDGKYRMAASCVEPGCPQKKEEKS